MPAVGVAGLVLEGEGEDGLALLDGVLALGVAGGEDGVDGVEGRGRGELVYLFLSVSVMRLEFASGGDDAATNRS